MTIQSKMSNAREFFFEVVCKTLKNSEINFFLKGRHFID